MSNKLTNFGGMSNVRVAASQPRRSGVLSRLLRARAARAVPMLAIAGFAALAVYGIAWAQEPHSNPWLLSWIPGYCCVTNDCCWEVSERELASLPEDKWEVVATRQVLQRSGWSPDGKFYRCACDYNSSDGKWIKHAGANTRCLFVPWRSASL